MKRLLGLVMALSPIAGCEPGQPCDPGQVYTGIVCLAAAPASGGEGDGATAGDAAGGADAGPGEAGACAAPGAGFGDPCADKSECGCGGTNVSARGCAPVAPSSSARASIAA